MASTRPALTGLLLLACGLTASADDADRARKERDWKIANRLKEDLPGVERVKREPLGTGQEQKILFTYSVGKKRAKAAMSLCQWATAFDLRGGQGVHVALYDTASAKAASRLFDLFRAGEETRDETIKNSPVQNLLSKKASDGVQVKGAKRAYGYERVVESRSKETELRLVVVSKRYVVVVTGRDPQTKKAMKKAAWSCLSALGALTKAS